MRVWVVWEAGDLVGVYADEALARADAAALADSFARDFPGASPGIEVFGVPLRNHRQF